MTRQQLGHRKNSLATRHTFNAEERYVGDQRQVTGDFILTSFAVDKSPSTYANKAAGVISGAIEESVSVIRNSDLRLTCEFSFGYFGEETTTEVTPFVPAADLVELPEIPRASSTYIFELYIRSIAALRTHIALLQDEYDRDPAGVFLFYLSDFIVGQSDYRLRDQALEDRRRAEEEGITLIMLGAGDNCSEQVGSELGQYVSLSLIDWQKTFSSWFAQSIRMKSMSQGQRVFLPVLKGKQFYA